MAFDSNNTDVTLMYSLKSILLLETCSWHNFSSMIPLLGQRIYELNSSLILWSVAILCTLLVSWWHCRRRSTNSVPKKWQCVGELSELTLFPVKSCGGISLQEAECTEYGIQTVTDGPLKLRDRFFIVVDEHNGMFKTARTHPKMVLINMALDGNDAVKLSAPDMSELQVKVPEYSENNKYSHCKFWGNEMLGTVDCGDMAAKWLSQYMLGKDNGVRLGYHLADIMPRRVADKNLKHCYKTLQDSDLGAYSDLSSFMLMTESSIADLKTRVPPDVSVVPRQFRPNFLVRASVAYEEDKWDWIRIGDTAVFRNVKPCTRCLFTTVDPNTGIKNPHKEPLSTLKRYRKLTDPTKLKVEGSAPAFGINLGLHRKGIVRVGDNVFVGTE